MSRRNGKKQSIRSIIMRPMILVNVIIVVIFVSTINTFDIFGRLRGGEVSNLRRSVSLRARQMEERLLSLGTTATAMSEQLSAEIQAAMELSGERLTGEETGAIIDLAMPVLTDGLRRKESSGAFVVVDGSLVDPAGGGFASGQASAIYLLDEAVTTTLSSTSDLMMLTGPKHLARNPILPLDSYWSTEMSFSMFDDASFLLRPFEAAQANPNLSIRRLCLWSRPVLMNGNREALMVTVPLRAGERVIGVVGMELSVDRLRSLLSAAELYDGESSFYAFAENLPTEAARHLFVTIGSFATRYIQPGQPYTTQVLPEYGDSVLEMHFSEDAVATTVLIPFNLYYQDSPFKDEGWALVGGVANNVIFGPTGTLLLTLVVAFSAAVAVALLFAYLMTRYIERPLVRLRGQLLSAQQDGQDLSLEHTDVMEVDLLIDSIESLSADLAESGRRTIRAIEMTEMPIGFIERNPSKGTVFLTDLAFRLLDLAQDPGVNTISISEWDEIYRRLLRHPEPETEGVYHLQSPNTTQQRYLRVRIAGDESHSFGILMDVTGDVLGRRELEHERDTDPLTGLFNRKAFLRRAKAVLDREPDRFGVMLFADLDNLKYVNDTYGHDMGDRYIQGAARMFAVLGEHGGVVSRISGDEFAIFIHGHEEREPLQKLLLGLPQMLDQAAGAIVLPDNSRLKMRYSMGYAWYPDDSRSLETLLRYADYAMYEIKRSEKGSMKHFSLASYMENSFLIEKNEAFNRVIEENLVYYVFQPIIDVHTGGIYGYEALMRPSAEEFPSVYHLLRMAQTQAKLYQVERLTFFNVFRWIDEHAKTLGGLRVFINSIPDQMLSPKDLQELEELYGPLFRHVVIEVTEAQERSDESLREKADFLRGLGADVAVDDFGRGYSSELTVLNINPDFIKIDMTLVQKIDLHDQKREIVGSIIHSAKRRGIRTIAEGVETQGELEEVIRLGVDYVQGFLFGMPDRDLKTLTEAQRGDIQALSARLSDRRKNRE